MRGQEKPRQNPAQEGSEKKVQHQPEGEPLPISGGYPQALEGDGKAHGCYHDYDEWSVSLANMETGAGGEKPDYHGNNQRRQYYVGIPLSDELGVGLYCSHISVIPSSHLRQVFYRR
jgi:hypothetical protein